MLYPNCQRRGYSESEFGCQSCHQCIDLTGREEQAQTYQDYLMTHDNIIDIDISSLTMHYQSPGNAHPYSRPLMVQCGATFQETNALFTSNINQITDLGYFTDTFSPTSILDSNNLMVGPLQLGLTQTPDCIQTPATSSGMQGIYTESNKLAQSRGSTYPNISFNFFEPSVETNADQWQALTHQSLLLGQSSVPSEPHLPVSWDYWETQNIDDNFHDQRPLTVPFKPTTEGVARHSTPPDCNGALFESQLNSLKTWPFQFPAPKFPVLNGNVSYAVFLKQIKALNDYCKVYSQDLHNYINVIEEVMSCRINPARFYMKASQNGNPFELKVVALDTADNDQLINNAVARASGARVALFKEATSSGANLDHVREGEFLIPCGAQDFDENGNELPCSASLSGISTIIPPGTHTPISLPLPRKKAIRRDGRKRNNANSKVQKSRVSTSAAPKKSSVIKDAMLATPIIESPGPRVESVPPKTVAKPARKRAARIRVKKEDLNTSAKTIPESLNNLVNLDNINATTCQDIKVTTPVHENSNHPEFAQTYPRGYSPRNVARESGSSDIASESNDDVFGS